MKALRFWRPIAAVAVVGLLGIGGVSTAAAAAPPPEGTMAIDASCGKLTASYNIPGSVNLKVDVVADGATQPQYEINVDSGFINLEVEIPAVSTAKTYSGKAVYTPFPGSPYAPVTRTFSVTCPVVEPPADKVTATPTSPSQTVVDGADNDKIVPPTIEGVTYTCTDWVNNQKMCKATAQSGYVLPAGSTTSWTFTDKNTQPEPTTGVVHVKQSSLLEHKNDCKGNNASGQLNVTNPKGTTLKSVKLSDGSYVNIGDITVRQQGNVRQYIVPLSDGRYIIDATIEAPAGWSGQFVLSHYTCGKETPPPVDVCPNIPGNQSEVPAGMVLEGGKCVTPPPPPVDVCPNIPGNQSEVPPGMMIVDGQCVLQPPVEECKSLSGAIFTTDASGDKVNGNLYDAKTDVYLQGGPDQKGAHLPDGTYYVQVTDTSGKTVLKPAFTVVVKDGVFPSTQLAPFNDTPNPGGEYKVWLSTSPNFEQQCTKTDNFKVKVKVVPPPTPTKVTPPAPTQVDKCEVKDDTYTIPSTEGVVYKVDGTVKPAGTYPGTGTVTIVASPASDKYSLEGQTEWTFTFTNVECPKPPVDVCPNIPGNQSEVPPGMVLEGGKCVPEVVYNPQGEVKQQCEINLQGKKTGYTLVSVVSDNSKSTTSAGYEVVEVIDGQALINGYVVDAGAVDRALLVYTPQDGKHVKVILQTDGGNVVLGQVEFDTADCVVPNTPPPPPVKVCPKGTTWVDGNMNGKVDNGECKLPTPPTKPQHPQPPVTPPHHPNPPIHGGHSGMSDDVVPSGMPGWAGGSLLMAIAVGLCAVAARRRENALLQRD